MDNRLNRSLAWPALTAALLALNAASAAAQLYKWVDERGRVNYSNQLPVDAKSAEKAAVVEDRVSVYSPDAALLRAVENDRQRTVQAALEKPEAWRPAVATIGGHAPVQPSEPESYVSDYPYWAGGGGYWGNRPQRPMHKIPQVKLPPGATAGNTVGLYSIIPGSSAPVPGTWSPITPPPAPRPRWDEPRPMTHGGQGWRR